jgi:hypothetical protein
MDSPSPTTTKHSGAAQRLLMLLVAVLATLTATVSVASASTASVSWPSSLIPAGPAAETRVEVATELAPVFVGSGRSVVAGHVGQTCPGYGGSVVGSCVATKVGPCSFSAETHVLMADGSTKPISEVRVGDEVVAQDPKTGERSARKVARLWVHDDQFVRLEIGESSVLTTANHPFWNDTDREWQRADQLDAGDLVLTADGRSVRVGRLLTAAGFGAAYNLAVDGVHTYHVLVGSDAILVHNLCPKAIQRLTEKLRGGSDIEVSSYEEARALLDSMDDLRPHVEGDLLPNPDGRMGGGFRQPNGTYRGDLINKSDPTAPVHPGLSNPDHANFPHYNIRFRDGTKAAIIIKG